MDDNKNVSVIEMVTNHAIYKELEAEMLQLKKDTFVLKQNGSSKGGNSQLEKSLKRNYSEVNIKSKQLS